MTQNGIEHTTFIIERALPGSVGHAFRFWADPILKARWNGCHPDWIVLEDGFDFRAGGSEIKRWRTPEGRELHFQAYYLDIVPDQRILYAYEMSFGGVRLSASLVTIELSPGDGTAQVKVTEQAAFLAVDGDAVEARINGTQEGYDRLVTLAAEEMSDAG